MPSPGTFNHVERRNIPPPPANGPSIEKEHYVHGSWGEGWYGEIHDDQSDLDSARALVSIGRHARTKTCVWLCHGSQAHLALRRHVL